MTNATVYRSGHRRPGRDGPRPRRVVALARHTAR